MDRTSHPHERPYWDCNTEEGRGHLERYQAAILQDVKRGAQKPMNMVKPSEVIERERRHQNQRLHSAKEPEERALLHMPLREL